MQLNPEVNAFQRKFVDDVRRCEDMERKLKYIEKEIKKNNIPILYPADEPPAPHPREINDLIVSDTVHMYNSVVVVNVYFAGYV